MLIDHDHVDWERLYRQVSPSVHRALVATFLDADLAADALHDAFVAALDRPPLHDANVAGWLFRVAVRKAGRARRRRTLSLRTAAPHRVSATGSSEPNVVGPRLPRMRHPLAVVILAALVATACGGGSATGPSPSGSPAASVRGILVARANDGGIVHARVGDRVQIALGTDFEWRIDPPDGIILVQGVQNYLLVRGTQAIWTAASTGTSSVSATGSVVCPSGKACILVAVLFRATVIVEP